MKSTTIMLEVLNVKGNNIYILRAPSAAVLLSTDNPEDVTNFLSEITPGVQPEITINHE